MTQVIKTMGILKNVSGRPILTAAGVTPLFLLDARRYSHELKDGDRVSEIIAIGSLPKNSRILNSTDSDGYAATYSTKDIPHFAFNGSEGMTVKQEFTRIDLPITIAIVYKIERGTWGDGGTTNNRIYGLGNSNRRLAFLSTSSKLLLWAGNTSGTGHYYDTYHSEWAVEIHQFNGVNSKLVDRFGDLQNIELDDSSGVGSINVWSNGINPSPSKGGIAYMAVYQGEISDSELMNLYYEAKNNFNLL